MAFCIEQRRIHYRRVSLWVRRLLLATCLSNLSHAHRYDVRVASGAFISLVSVVTTRLGSAEDVGLRTGVQMTVMSLGEHVYIPLADSTESRRPLQELWPALLSQVQFCSAQNLSTELESMQVRIVFSACAVGTHLTDSLSQAPWSSDLSLS